MERHSVMQKVLPIKYTLIFEQIVMNNLFNLKLLSI